MAVLFQIPWWILIPLVGIVAVFLSLYAMSLSDSVGGFVGLGVWAGAAFILWYVLIRGNPDTPKSLVFAGRVNHTNQGRWLNDRLVLLYAQEVEAARSRTQVASFQEVLSSPTDGVFTLSVPNLYAVKTSDLNCKTREFSNKTTFCWLGDVREDSSGATINIPHKKLNYVVRWLPGEYDTLPEEMKETGVTGLSEGNIVIMPTKPQPTGWFDKLLGRTPQPSKENSVPNLVQSVHYDPEPEVVEVPSQSATSVLDNCRGSETVRQSFTDGKTFVHEYVLQGSLGLDIPIQTIQLQLGAQGSYRQKQISTKTIKYEIAAKPGTNVSYKIHLQEVWRKGIAVVRGKQGPAKVPFRVQSDLKYFVKTDATTCSAF